MRIGDDEQETTTLDPLPTPAPQVAPAGTLHLSTPQPGATSASPSAVTPLDSAEPPAKRQRIKLNVRPRDSTGATNAAAASNLMQQSPDTTFKLGPNGELRVVYDEMMDVPESMRIPYSDDSDLSSVGATPPPPPMRLQPVVKPQPPTVADREYGANFMSYYVDGGDEEEAQPQSQPQPQPQPTQTTQSQPSRPPPTAATAQQNGGHSHHRRQQRQQPLHHMSVPGQHTHKPRHHSKSQHVPPPPVQHRPPPPPVQVTVTNVILVDFDTIGKTNEPNRSQTVRGMVNKLERLSTALSSFSGVPAVSDGEKQKKTGELPTKYAEQQMDD
jgi:hypothetical protein